MSSHDRQTQPTEGNPPVASENKHLYDAQVSGTMDHEQEQMAQDATDNEHELTTWQALVKYRKAAGWSMLVSMSIIMRAYDIEITGNHYALPAFTKTFGEEVPGHGNHIPTQYQVAMSMGPIVGQVAGAWLAAVPMDKYGRKRTLAGYLILTTGLIFLQVFAVNIAMLTVSMYLSGLIWGGYHVIAPTYASEVLPMRLRGYFTGYVSVCYVAGQLLQTGITRGFVNWDSVWAWKTSYAIQWAWPVIILAGLYWTPESPWWFVRQNRLEDAKMALDRLSHKSLHAANANVLAMMVRTDNYEQEIELGSTYRDLFKGSNLRRLEIASMAFVVQNFSGNSPGFATYLFKQVGLSTENAFNMSIGLTGIGFVGCALSGFVIQWLGRRRAWMCGLFYCLAVLWTTALTALAPDYRTNEAYSWAQATLMITMQMIYSLTINPLGFVISSEVPSTRLRAKTLSVTATVNGASYLVITIAGPYLLNPGSSSAGIKINFLWGGLTVLNTIWSYFRLPETGNRTYEELDIMFNRGVPARKFRDYVIEDLDEREGKVPKGEHVE